MSPKSLLRLPAATSRAAELMSGRFQRVLDDVDAPPADKVERIFLCSGKVAFDLLDERRRRGDRKTAVIRLEQLYPFREAELARVFAQYGAAKDFVWVQEEPLNMGAAFFIEPRLRKLVAGKGFRVVARAESASPATGTFKAHNLERR